MSGNTINYSTLFSQDKLDSLFPLERSNQFFEALFGDSDEGAYDIRLAFKENQADTLLFELELHQRPGKCLACNLTYGLPKVFTRHPVIDINGIVAQLDQLLGDRARCGQWQLGSVREVSRELHVIPLMIDIN
ncbi:MAG: pancreas/duodenum homeobox protein 1 [Desulfobacteraceae bacterium]|jgi:hypothetical protein